MAVLSFWFTLNTALEKRISDCSSEVCAADLPDGVRHLRGLGTRRPGLYVAEALPARTVVLQARQLVFLADHGRHLDRKSVVAGQRVSGRVDLGGRRNIDKATGDETSRRTYALDNEWEDSTWRPRRLQK